jgi:hypothetical protein
MTAPIFDIDGKPVIQLRREEWIAFLTLLRQVFLSIVNWIERRYPETID